MGTLLFVINFLPPFLGAMGTVRGDFGPQLEYFSKKDSRFKIVSFDLRWCGTQSSNTFIKRDSDFFRTDALNAHTVMQALHFSKYSVFGWSSGAMSSLILAASFPESVRKLVTWGALAYLTKEDIAELEKIRDISTWNQKMRDPYLKIYGSASLVQKLWSDYIDTNVDILNEKDGDICKEEISKISCQTLIVHGSRDPLVPVSHSEFIRDRITGSKLVVMENGSHNLHLRYHQEFNEMVEKFLNE